MKNYKIYEKDEIIIEEGCLGEELFYIEEGYVQIFTKKGNSIIEFTRLGPNEYFGEMALIYDSPRSASVRAIQETKLKVIHRREINDLLDDTKMREKFLGQIFTRIVNLNSKLKRLEDKNSFEFKVDYSKSQHSNLKSLLIEGLNENAEKTLGYSKIEVNNFPFTVGRNTRDPLVYVDLELSDEKPYQISRRHFEFDIINDCLHIIDSGSALGLVVNNQRIGSSVDDKFSLPLNKNKNIVLVGSDSSKYLYKISIK